jgi:hypothetical protein
MDNKTAKQIVNEALNIAISKGCFGLVEVTNIVEAIKTINAETESSFEELSEITED